MSTTPQIRRRFGLSFAKLHVEACRLLGALNDPTIAETVLARLPPTQLDDFTSQVELVSTLATRKSDALGALASLTKAQRQAVAELNELTAVARQAAVLAFRGNDALLHGQFQVGSAQPQSIAAILDRARSLLAACQAYEDELNVCGWPPTENTVLEAAITALAKAQVDQSTSSDVKETATGRRAHEANALYQQCLRVQNAARAVYSKAKVAKDPALFAGRARFLLDEFPRARRSAASSPTTPSTPTGSGTPATGATTS